VSSDTAARKRARERMLADLEAARARRKRRGLTLRLPASLPQPRTR
jgi:hypothetical protein